MSFGLLTVWEPYMTLPMENCAFFPSGLNSIRIIPEIINHNRRIRSSLASMAIKTLFIKAKPNSKSKQLNY